MDRLKFRVTKGIKLGQQRHEEHISFIVNRVLKDLIKKVKDNDKK